MTSTDTLIQAARAMVVVTRFDVIASTLFTWDFFLTFPLEYKLVWRARWNTMTVLFLIQRYLPFIDTVGLVFYYQLKSKLGDMQCKLLYIISASMITIGMTCSEVMLTLRVYALWSQDRRLIAVLPIVCVLFWVPGFCFLAIFLRSLEFATDLPSPVVGCLLIHANRTLTICWAVILIWNATVLGLTIIPGYRAYKEGGNSALTMMVYRDGISYYFYLFFLSAMNIAIARAFPLQYAQLLASTTRCVHSTLTSRVLLHIREHANPTDSSIQVGEDFGHEMASLDQIVTELHTTSTSYAD